MAIQDSINTARQRGASDDVILQKIIQQNPNKQALFDTARQRGADSTRILNEILKQNQTREPTGTSGVAGLALGVAKSFFGGARSVAGTLQTGGQAALAAITPGKSFQDLKQETGIKSISDETPEGAQVKKQLTPQGKTEKIGAAAETIAEFVLPFGSTTKALTSERAINFTRNVAEKFVNAATGRGGRALRSDIAKEIPKILKEGQELLPTYARRFLDFGKWFYSPRQGLKASQEVLTQTAKEFDKLIASEVGKRPVQFGDLLSNIQNYVKQLAKVIPDSAEKTELMKKLGTSIRPTLTWAEGLNLKRAINSLFPPSTFFKDAKLSATNKSLQRSVLELSNRLEKVAADTNFSQLNNAWNLFSDTYNQLLKKVAPSQTFGAEDILSKTLGTALKPAATILEAISTPIEMTSAKALNFASKVQEKARPLVDKFPNLFLK